MYEDQYNSQQKLGKAKKSVRTLKIVDTEKGKCIYFEELQVILIVEEDIMRLGYYKNPPASPLAFCNMQYLQELESKRVAPWGASPILSPAYPKDIQKNNYPRIESVAKSPEDFASAVNRNNGEILYVTHFNFTRLNVDALLSFYYSRFDDSLVDLVESQYGGPLRNRIFGMHEEFLGEAINYIKSYSGLVFAGVEVNSIK